MNKGSRVLAALTLAVFVSAPAVAAPSWQNGASTLPAEAPSAQDADALFQSQNWDGAAKAYEAIVKRDPSDGRAWFRLGQSLHSAGKYAGAADAFQRAAERGFQAPGAMVRAARAYARMNEKDKAIEWLDKGVQAGFGQYQALGADADMASLRDEARFKDAVARAERNAKPCASTPEHRQFDFWVGEWDVQTPQGQLAGTNSVQSILDGCVVFENWAGAGGGGSGKSFNYYNPATRRWHQLWVSNTGNVLEFAGELKDGQMRYTGESPGAQGGKVMHRLTFFNSSADRVRQLWEQSADGGRTWNVAFDGTYVRKK